MRVRAILVSTFLSRLFSACREQNWKHGGEAYALGIPLFLAPSSQWEAHKIVSILTSLWHRRKVRFDPVLTSKRGCSKLEMSIVATKYCAKWSFLGWKAHLAMHMSYPASWKDASGKCSVPLKIHHTGFFETVQTFQRQDCDHLEWPNTLKWSRKPRTMLLVQYGCRKYAGKLVNIGGAASREPVIVIHGRTLGSDGAQFPFAPKNIVIRTRVLGPQMPRLLARQLSLLCK